MQADGKLQRSGVCGGISYYPLARVLSLSKVYGLVKTALHGNKRQIDDDFKLYLALLRDIVKLSASRNQTVVVGFLRDQDDYFASSSYSNQQIVDAIKALNVQVIDLTLADKSENVDPKYVLSRYDPHPSAAGDALRGPMVADVLRKALASK